MTEVGREKATGATKARMERNFIVAVELVVPMAAVAKGASDGDGAKD
jgi:hypothetical protein